MQDLLRRHGYEQLKENRKRGVEISEANADEAHEVLACLGSPRSYSSEIRGNKFNTWDPTNSHIARFYIYSVGSATAF